METKTDFTEDIVHQWRKTWAKKDIQNLVDSCSKDTVGLSYFRKYFSKDGTILECGCGLGQWLVYLEREGYKMVGVEIVSDCIDACKSFFPETKIYTGDVRALPFEENSFDGYISIGVLEHMIEGPETVVQEMQRVLKPGGVAVITVPAMNIFMQWWYPLRTFLVQQLRYNQFFRSVFAKSIRAFSSADLKSRMRDIQKELRPEFWASVGADQEKGLVFIEYKFRRDQLEKMFSAQSLKIIESVPIKHPYAISDNFGRYFFKNRNALSGELNFLGRCIYSIFTALHKDFFNYINLIVVQKK